MVRRQVVVTGRVQGVWFRETCKEQAEALGVTGWVRNRDDGRVEAAFEGEPDAVDQMVTWCRSGSSLASVDDIEVTEQDPVGDRGFTTR
jgi:acylphosphatase